MYTEQELNIADTFTRDMFELRGRLYKEAISIVTRWGRNLIDYKGLEVRSYIHQHSTPYLVLEIGYPEEFAANMTLRYEDGVVSYSKGSTGEITKAKAPKQCDIYLLQAKLIEHEDKLRVLLYDYTKKYLQEIKRIEKEQNRLDKEYPGLRKAYSESQMYAKRLAQ